MGGPTDGGGFRVEVEKALSYGGLGELVEEKGFVVVCEECGLFG